MSYNPFSEIRKDLLSTFSPTEIAVIKNFRLSDLVNKDDSNDEDRHVIRIKALLGGKEVTKKNLRITLNKLIELGLEMGVELVDG